MGKCLEGGNLAKDGSNVESSQGGFNIRHGSIMMECISSSSLSVLRLTIQVAIQNGRGLMSTFSIDI